MKLSIIKTLAVFFSLTAILHTGFVNADEVDAANVTDFSNGSPADADEVNANFQALITAINDNASRLAALESSSASSDNSVAGKTFKLNQIGILLIGNGEGAATSANLSQSYIVTFNSNMTYTFIGEENEGELNTVTGAFGNVTQGEAVDLSGSYTQTGSNVALDIDGESITFSASLDGNVIILSEFGFGDDGGGFTRSETSFLVGVATN